MTGAAQMLASLREIAAVLSAAARTGTPMPAGAEKIVDVALVELEAVLAAVPEFQRLHAQIVEALPRVRRVS